MIRYQADPKHRRLFLEHFCLGEDSRALKSNGEKEVEDKGEECEELGLEETTVFRGLAARVSLLSLDCPDLQFSGKAASREMAKPTLGSWKILKKLARYLLGREAVVWVFGWQDEVELAHTFSDSDWGGMLRIGNRLQGEFGCWGVI